MHPGGRYPGLRVAAFLAAIFIPAGITTAFLPLWLADRGLSAAGIGQVLVISTFGRLLATPGWGRLADRFGGRRAVLAAAAALAMLASLAFLPAQGFAVLLLATVAQGASASALMPVADALTLALAQTRGRLDAAAEEQAIKSLRHLPAAVSAVLALEGR
ncbi:MFS transporter [Comamonas sp.]|uniref:MFS transporter n=1 Tax=Comamonas sp. TaxID=34028 RepID=UPI001AD030DC|nr:MFS transporter [Comamonas sp.]MBN9331210.1 MFS transporter [Comamonas sp.]